MTTYFDVLEELDPLGPDPGSVEQSWSVFTKNHPELFYEGAPKQKRRPRIKVGRLIEAAVLMAAVLVISAAAFHWPNYIASWGIEIFSIGLSKESGDLELDVPGESGFISLEEATNEFSKNKVTPTWIPSKFSIDNIFVQRMATFIKITAVYSAIDDSEFTIRVMVYNDDIEVPQLVAEDMEHEREVYSLSGIDHIVSKNYNRMQALWKNGQCLCEISGDLTKSEIERMITSIYEG